MPPGLPYATLRNIRAFHLINKFARGALYSQGRIPLLRTCHAVLGPTVGQEVLERLNSPEAGIEYVESLIGEEKLLQLHVKEKDARKRRQAEEAKFRRTRRADPKGGILSFFI